MVDAFERDGDPVSIAKDRMKRRAGAYAGLTLISGGLYASSQVMYSYGEKIAPRAIERGMKWNARAGRTYMAGKTVGKLATRGVPVLGPVMIAYDVYTLVDWAFAKGKLPYGARDRA